jgi:glycosyltransferase involved in cell wall biosynthesis
MGSGLATVVSAEPGALGDLAVDGTNCLVVPTHDPSEWANALSLVVREHDFRRSLAEHGRQTILSRWTLEHSVDAMVAGFRLGVLQGT